MLRGSLCWVMLVILPRALLGQSGTDQNGLQPPVQEKTGAAILHSQGGVWVNGYEAQDSSAVFPGDLVETKPGSTASLSLDGAMVLIQSESVAKLGNNLLELDHGDVFVGTSKGFKVKVHCLTVVPVLMEWTGYEVADLNNNVQVSARKDDVKVEREIDLKKPSPDSAASHGTVVHESEQKNFDQSEICGGALLPHTPISGLNPKVIAGIAAGGGGIILCAILCRGSGTKTPAVSASTP